MDVCVNLKKTHTDNIFEVSFNTAWVVCYGSSQLSLYEARKDISFFYYTNKNALSGRTTILDTVLNMALKVDHVLLFDLNP